MITLENFDEVAARVKGAYVAVGNFDGVHQGHAQLLARLKARADSAGACSLALTFDPPPVAILRPEAAPVPLTSIDRRLALMKEAGAGEVGVFKTGPWLLGLTAREFFDRVILTQLGAKGVVEGPTFGFGRDRGGDSTLLQTWCASAGLEFEVVSPTELDGKIVSSTRIRQALAEGNVEDANRWLGHRHRIRGLITHGAGRGAGIGVPTANLDHIETVIPADGVYAVLATTDDGAISHIAACNIGPNPTFGEQIHKVEAHLIDFSGDLYGRTLELQFLQRLRSTRRFSGLDDLLDQIHRDVDQARQIGLQITGR